MKQIEVENSLHFVASRLDFRQLYYVDYKTGVVGIRPLFENEEVTFNYIIGENKRIVSVEIKRLGVRG